MAFFALLWKARTIENYRLNYEKEKINSIELGNAQLEQTLSQRWRHYRFDTKKRISRIFRKWYPEGNVVSNFILYLMTDQTFPNFLLKSVMGFVGGIILTYLCFMFFVFQLAISLIHATIMSSIIGVLLTLGLAFSYRIRCLVFLLIPQFFSRVGRYTLTCYALVLILTGPATNTLKNSEVLSESMACSQEQIKTSVHQLNDVMKKPINAMKDSLKRMVDQLKVITAKVKETVIRLDRLVLSIVNTIQSSFSWLQSVADICNAQLGTPYDRCCNAIQDGFAHCQKSLGPKGSVVCNVVYVAQAACFSVKPFKAFCYATDFMDEAILASVKKKLRNFTEHLRAMFHVEVHIHHSYSYSSNSSRSASQVAAGIVTEIRNRADPLLTWLSWSSCVTSLFLLLIIFRAKYYQHMYETRSRFDNRYVTKELQELDLKRQQQGRETVLPLNRRERAKYITTSSLRLVASEKVYLNRSAVFMAITTFKLLIHMVADYSLYWVLMTIRYHGRFQSDMMRIPHSGAHVSGNGFVARLFSTIVGILDLPLSFPAPSPIPCLPDPYPPDLRRYTQIGVLIFLLWFFALFEPYGLRLRHLIMGHYRPERAKARATWLYNHILRTRGSFMKFARRKLHREYKYSSEASLTFRQWITDHVPCQTPGCPGVFCISCFTDIGELCTICLSPADYGDLSDVSLEKGSSDDSDNDDDAGLSKGRMIENIALHSTTESDRTIKPTGSKDEDRRWSFFTKTTGPRGPLDTIALLHTGTYKNKRTCFTTFFQKRFSKMKRNMKKRCRVKKQTSEWVAKHTRENMFKDFSKEVNHNYYSNCHDMEEYGEFDEVINRRKSIGVNTDRNRGVLLNMLMNSFARRRFKQSRTKHKKAKPELKQYYKKLSIRRKKELTNTESSKKSFSSTKTFHTHYSTIRQRNLKNIIRSMKDSRTQDKSKGYEELKGIMKAIRNFLKSNEIKNMSNQNHDNAANNSPIENSQKITKVPNNTNFGEQKSKKKCTKGNKPNRLRKPKADNKIKTKNSRHRIAKFHQFFSNHWKNFKCSIMPGNAQNRSDFPIPKEKRNHKRRKKQKHGVDLNEIDIEECFAKKDIKHTRNLRLSAFLAELDWTKRDYRKEKDIDEVNDSYLHTRRAPGGTKIVGMVQLKNLPFQWRVAPENEFCNGRNKKCMCVKKQSTTRLFVTLSKQKLYAKKALERFRNKINTSSSLVHKMISSVSAMRGDSSFNRALNMRLVVDWRERSCVVNIISSNEALRIIMIELHNSVLDTEMLFQNAKYGDIMQVPSDEINAHLLEDISDSDISPFLGKEISVGDRLAPPMTLSPRVSHLLQPRVKTALKLSLKLMSCSSEQKTKINKKRCKCDVYDDLQRKWDHVKKSLSEIPGTKNPFSMLKNFCSSLFGPSCTVDTCPNKRETKQRDKEAQKIIKKKTKKTYTCHNTDGQDTCTNTPAGCQTQTQKDTGTQLTNEEEVMEAIKDFACAREKANLEECLRKELQRKQQPVNQGIQFAVKPEAESRPCQVVDCPECCHCETQYEVEDQDATDPKTSDSNTSDPENEAVKANGSYMCPCGKPMNCTKLCLETTYEPKTHKENDSVKAIGSMCPCGECICLEAQYEEREGTDPKTHEENEAVQAIGSYMCPGDEHMNCTKLGLEAYESKTHEENEPSKATGSFMYPCDERGIQIVGKPEMTSRYSQAVQCAKCCHRETQYEDQDATDPKTSDPNTSVPQTCDPKTHEKKKAVKGVGSYLCQCDQAVQIFPNLTCTCATQHSGLKLSNMRYRQVNSMVVNETIPVNPVVNKETQHIGAEVAHKTTHCTARKHYKKVKDVKSGTAALNHKLSLESSLLLKRGVNVAKILKDELTDYTSDTSKSSVSLRSDESKTDTTICSLATINYNDTPRRRKHRIKVVTKQNQSTLTDKTRVCDTGTITQDWWSPLVERKANDPILLEKKRASNFIEKQKELRELKEWRELRDVRKRRRNTGVTADGRNVTFRSRTQIIPTVEKRDGAIRHTASSLSHTKTLFPGVKDIMSPSRYLLESQKYYNELFAYNYRPRTQAAYNYVTQIPRYHEKEKTRSPVGSRRNHHRKTKRLDECYSPIRQLSPRKRKTEPTRTSDSPRRKTSHRHDRQSNNRHHAKNNSPRKRL